jgi:hypothetical protein
MFRVGLSWRLPLLAIAAALLLSTPAVPQGVRVNPAAKPVPRLEPVAETRLLMDGLNQANFSGLEKMLKEKPADGDGWTFARGQALLIAETGNLLMLRPPKNQGQDAWMERSRELREAATGLARAASARDFDRSRTALTEVANACTHCHQTFRVAVRVVPFAEANEGKPTPAP